MTERHILYALTLKAIAAAGKGEPLAEMLRKPSTASTRRGMRCKSLLNVPTIRITITGCLGVFKSHLVEKFYVDATDECPPYPEFIAFVKEIGAISAYAYLGDVGNSVTGDKKTQVFEDAFLDMLIGVAARDRFQRRHLHAHPQHRQSS